MAKDKSYPILTENTKNGKKMLAVVIDPDKQDEASLLALIKVLNSSSVDLILVGGSLMTKGNIATTIALLKKHTSLPTLIFPSDTHQICSDADGILFLSLLSGRNPHFLIHSQVLATPILKNSNLEIIPTGYLLVDTGTTTTAIYISGTPPIPYKKHDIAATTALTGEYLGMKLIYIDAGSGASTTISPKMVTAVKKNITIPLIIGGGIKTVEDAKKIYEAGADIIVIGNVTEENPSFIHDITNLKDRLNS